MPRNPNDHPALTAWRTRDGSWPRQAWTLDNLWRAACWEMNAREATSLGLSEWADQCRRYAAKQAPDLYSTPARAAVRVVRVTPKGRAA